MKLKRNDFETVLKLLFRPKQNAQAITFHFVVGTVLAVYERRPVADIFAF